MRDPRSSVSRQSPRPCDGRQPVAGPSGARQGGRADIQIGSAFAISPVGSRQRSANLECPSPAGRSAERKTALTESPDPNETTELPVADPDAELPAPHEAPGADLADGPAGGPDRHHGAPALCRSRPVHGLGLGVSLDRAGALAEPVCSCAKSFISLSASSLA